MFLNIFIGIYLLNVPVLIVAALTNTAIVGLYENGTVRDSTEIPFCDNEKRLNLSSYSLRIKNCKTSGRCQFTNKPLSPKAVMLLHDKCSFKTECDNLDFTSVAKEHNDSLHDVVIGYHCFGDEERQYDMCGPHTETMTGKAHLMARNTSNTLYSRCQCLLRAENNSVVTVTLKDIRLYSSDISQRKCSTSVLKINENAFECNATSIAFGSVFNDDLPTMAQNDTLKVTIDLEDPVFDMVWLIAQTQGSMSVNCTGTRREVSTVLIKAYAPGSKFQPDVISKDELTGTTESFTVSLVVVLVTVVMIAMTIIVYMRMRRGNNTSSKCIICFSDDRRKEQFNKDIFETGKHTKFGQYLRHWIRFLFHHKSMKSSQSPLYQMSVETEAVLEKDGPICVEVHTESSFCPEESPLADETEESAYSPVQESERITRDAAVENNHTYAPLDHSLSKFRGVGINETEIYNTTQSRSTPQKNPTYGRLMAVQSSTPSNYARNKFLLSQI